jgi:hypothetical protein
LHRTAHLTIPDFYWIADLDELPQLRAGLAGLRRGARRRAGAFGNHFCLWADREGHFLFTGLDRDGIASHRGHGSASRFTVLRYGLGSQPPREYEREGNCQNGPSHMGLQG